MIRKGTFARYKGKEYPFIREDSQTICLVSQDINDMDNGFLQRKENIYTKIISIPDANSMYYVIPHAKYKGEKFGVSDGRDGRLLLSTSNNRLGERFGFEMVDNHFYTKYVLESEVELLEETEPYFKTEYERRELT